MDSKQLLRIDKSSRIIFIISSMLLIALVILNIIMEKDSGFSKYSNVVGIMASIVGLICFCVATALKYAKKHDMNLQQPKEKKKDSGTEINVSDDGDDDDDGNETNEPKKNRSSSSGLTELSPVRVFARTAGRLNREIQYQKYWSYANLIISIVLTIIAFVVIVIYAFFTNNEDVLNNNETSPWVAFIILSLPRFCLVVFIEIIAMAFYKSHKSNLDNIKYYQNEITSIESRRIALVTAIFTGNGDMQKECIQKLIEVDRNFKLQDGETTIELEKLKHEYNYLNKALNSLKDIITVKE